MKEKQQMRFAQAIAILPANLQHSMLALPDAQKVQVEEMRLRAGQVPSIVIQGAERALSQQSITSTILHDILARATQYSVHSFGDCLSQGFLPLAGGHRLGLCGTVTTQQGEITGIRVLSSLTLRIASEQQGVADGIVSQVMQNGVQNTLILSPPAFGKTTLLRDLIRQISQSGIRVGVADARGEIASLHGGVPQFDMGRCTDVLDGCPKAQGLLQLLRTMSPQVLALDEITDPQDAQAIGYVANCGVRMLATIHATSVAELQQKPLYQSLLAQNIFQMAVVIDKNEGQRRYAVQYLAEEGRTC